MAAVPAVRPSWTVGGPALGVREPAHLVRVGGDLDERCVNREGRHLRAFGRVALDSVLRDGRYRSVPTDPAGLGARVSSSRDRRARISAARSTTTDSSVRFTVVFTATLPGPYEGCASVIVTTPAHPLRTVVPLTTAAADMISVMTCSIPGCEPTGTMCGTRGSRGCPVLRVQGGEVVAHLRARVGDVECSGENVSGHHRGDGVTGLLELGGA